MSKINLNNIANLQNESTVVSTLATNNATIVAAMDNTLSRDGTTPNTMLSNLDMNSNTFLNLPTPTLAGDAVRKDYGDTNYGPAALAIAQTYVTAAAASASTATTQAGIATTQATNSATSATNAQNSYLATLGIIGDQYKYSSSTTSSDPGAGFFRLNNATMASVTQMYISETDNLGNALAQWIGTWDDSTSSNKAVITIEKLSAPTTVWYQFYVSGNNTDNGTWDTITLTPIGGPGGFTNNDLMVMGVELIGNKGQDGSGTGDVTAASTFGTDNRLIRSDGTGKGVQSSGITIDDSNNVSGLGTLASTTSTATSLALNGATIGTDALGVTGTATISGQLNAASFVPTSATVPLQGMFLGAAGQLNFATATTNRFAIAANLFSANTSGPQIQNAAASSTVPTLIPNRSDTTTGIGAQAAGNISLITSGTEQARVDSTGLTVTSGLTVNGSPTYGNIPQNSQSAAYTLVASDAQKHIYHPSADTTARIWTIPANASVAYPLGTAITFINDSSAGVITIAITSDTLVLTGAGTTGSRTLAANGMATAIKMTTTRWQISGTGLT